MLTKTPTQLWLTCDECGEETRSYDDDEFIRMMDDAKADGWEICKNRFSQWEHFCPECNRQTNRLAAAKRLFGKR